MLAKKLRAATAAAADPSWDSANAGDLAHAVFLGTPINYFSVAAQEYASNGLFFKPDGLKMYVIGSTGDAIWSYDFV